jgi:hypothetical protein
MPRWKTALDVLLIPIALFRVVIAYSVDVAMTFHYPMALRGCAAACAGAWCEWNCRLRGALRIDLSEYVASGVDPASTALDWPIRLMTGFYFLCVAPFMALLVYSLWAKKPAIRTPAIVMATLMAAMMGALLVRTAWGTPPSTNVGLFLLYNALDVAAPLLILLRVVPRPLFS